MLGVLKRRWKPKRSSAGSRIPCDSNSLEGDKPRSAHQVHPVLDARHLVGYEKTERADTPPPPPPQRCLPLAPNICVEAGQIQFVKHEDESTAPPANGTVNTGRVTVTRGLQTEGDEFLHVQSKVLSVKSKCGGDQGISILRNIPENKSVEMAEQEVTYQITEA
ncbi:uncharacterized protein LOC115883081 [Sitophilus oryzae]|uniref:Uncharacterized protein LOC115883081 n=1 Tax=Sitophilus oryzae TaxID=7048 RepID=A0A6J2Y0J1_SITOR|nr:uncharacterized protein LOC115883081 [Sitophilus oryzae]